MREGVRLLRRPPLRGVIAWGCALLGAIAAAELWPAHPVLAATLGANVPGGLLLHARDHGTS